MSAANYDTARDTVRARYAASGWTDVPVLWDAWNQDESETSPSLYSFRPRLDGGRGDVVGISNSKLRRRHFFSLVTEYRAPIETGDQAAHADIQALLDRFDRWTSSGVVFNEPGWAQDIGSEDGVSHLWRIFQPFYYEETV